MAGCELIDATTLGKLLKADFAEGKLYWRQRSPELFKGTGARYTAERAAKIFNTRYADREAFTASDASGYLVGRIFDKAYKAHRVIWAMAHGRWPDGEIDHINGIPGDNRMANLRVCTSSQNKMNQRPRRNKASKFRGVTFSKCAGKWSAEIQANGIRHYLGLFDAEQDAANAYRDASQRLHGDFGKLHDGGV